MSIRARSLAQDGDNRVILRPGRDKPVRQRHPWIFSGSIARLPAGTPDGAIVEVSDSGGGWLARGYLNRASQIQVRLLTWDADEAIDGDFWRRRLACAVAARAPLAAESNALRLVNAESDFLPGLTVDQAGDFLVLQAGTLAVDQRKGEFAALLLELTGARGVVERSDAALRKLEGLEAATGLLAGDAPAGPVEVHEHGARFLADLFGGQKTGFYSDQRANRQRVAAYCAGQRVLNAFAYMGAFGVHALLHGATHVTNVDSSYEALEGAEANLRLNGLDPEAVAENIAGDVFTVLRDFRREPDRQDYGIVILDPPKFAHHQGQVERALRGYKDINLQALHLLPPGGILATFSCSGLVSAELFQKVVFGAAVDAGRAVQVLEWLRQDRDHPVALTFPEGEYLKGLICRVL